MRFSDFKRQFSCFNGISSQDVKNAFGGVNQSQMAIWKRRGEILSVRRGMYVLHDSKIDSLLLANEMNDSYVSLEFALSYYQIIPEMAQSITSVSNNRKEHVENALGNFYYSKITPKLFCGFALTESQTWKGRFVRIAEQEKALFDLVYFRNDLREKKDFDSLRLHTEKIRMGRIKQYVSLVRAPQIRRRLDNFVIYLNALTSRD